MANEAHMVVREEGEVVENDNNDHNLVQEVRRFNCKFCNQTFTTPQALGGHQNLHRAQRNALKLASPTRAAEILNHDHLATMPPYFPPVPMSPFHSMQPPSLLHSFNPHRFQPTLIFTEPPVCQPWCSGHGVGSSGGGGGGDDTAIRLTLDEIDQMRKPYEVNLQALMRGARYYEEERKDKDGDKLDLTLHL